MAHTINEDDRGNEREPTMSDSFDSKGKPVTRKQAASKGMDDGWTVTGTLITGIAFWGFAGWGLSKWTGWVGFFPIGVILGAVAGVYLVYKQASAPPPLLDISRNQDGGLLTRHAKRLEQQKAEREQAERESAQHGDETLDPDDRNVPPPAAGAGEDEGHTDSGKESGDPYR